MTSKFFHFSQNNSGGFHHVDEVVDVGGVVFEADSATEANDRARKAGVFARHFCECCGPRFSPAWETETGESTVEASAWAAFGEPVVVHFKDGTSRKMQFTKE